MTEHGAGAPASVTGPAGGGDEGDGIVARVTDGHRQSSRVALVIHVLTLVSSFVVLLSINRDQWFFGDEWDFLGHRGLSGAERSLWEPHTEHWSTGPILIYRALYSLYGLRTYVPYVVVLLLLHVAVAHLLWRVLLRAGVDQVVATALAGVFAFLGAGYENLLWAFQIGFIGSVALGLAGLQLVNHDGPWDRRDFGAWGVSIVGLMFSGVSVTMVAVAGLAVLMRRGWRHAAATVAVPGAVYLVWFLAIGDKNVGDSERTLDDLFKYPAYIWNGLRTAIEETVGFPGAGAVILLGLAGFLLRRGGRSSGPAAPAFACALGALMLFAIIATGRAGLGIEQSGASRYTYLVIALAVPAIGLALTELAGDGLSTTGRRASACLLLLFVGVHNVGTLVEESRQEKRLEQGIQARILAAAQLVNSPAAVLGGNPEPQFSPDIVVDDLRRMHRDGKLPEPRRISPDDRLTVATVLQYAVNPGALETPFSAPLVDGVVGADGRFDANGCISLFPTSPSVELHLAGGEPMSLRVTTLTSGELVGYLRLFTPLLLTGPAHVDPVRAGVPVYVNVTAPVDQVVLRVPPTGTTEVCGIR